MYIKVKTTWNDGTTTENELSIHQAASFRNAKLQNPHVASCEIVKGTARSL